jgi:uncharacterized membrane protein
MRVAVLLAPLLLATGVAAVVGALLTGGAGAAIVVVVPVVFGSSLLFLAGVLLLIAGLFTLLFAFGGVEPAAVTSGPRTGSGGLLLVGPVPIFWGSARGASRSLRVVAALAGGVLLALAVLLAIGWFR